MIDWETEFGEEKKSGFLRMKEWKESGKKAVGIFCSYTPVELIDAAGAAYVALCGSTMEGIEEAERVLPKTICPLIKASYGLAATDKCPYFHFSDMILAETTCDGKKKMYELMGEMKPTHVMQLPQGLDSNQAVDFWENEIYRAKEAIEKTLKVAITEENLRKAIHRKNEERKAILEFYELGRLNPSPYSVKHMLQALDWSSYSFDLEEITEKIRSLTRRILEDYKNIPRKKKENRPRILITGCPTSGVREKIIYQIEELGGRIVSFENCGGPRCQKDLVDEEKEPMRALAEKYMRISCSVMSPNDNRLEYMKEMIEEYQADGVIEVVLQGCHTFAIESYKVRRFVTEELKKPYLYIGTDFSSADKGQNATRIKAFLEMLS